MDIPILLFWYFIFLGVAGAIIDGVLWLVDHYKGGKTNA